MVCSVIVSSAGVCHSVHWRIFSSAQSCATRFVWFIFCGGAFADVGNRLWCPRLVRRRAFGVGAARCFQDCFNKNATELFWNHPDYLRLASLLVLFWPCAVFASRAASLLVLFHLVAWRPWMNMPRMPNGIQHTVGFSNGFGSGKRKRQSRRLFPVGLTLPWLEKVRAAYLMSGCDLAITLFAAQKFSGLRPEDADYPTLDLVEEIAVSVPLDASIRVRVRKEVAEVLLVKEIEKLNLRGVVPSLAAVYAMYEAFEPSSRCIGYRGRIAWVQRFRKRWGLSRRAWSCQPEIEKGKVGPQIWGR